MARYKWLFLALAIALVLVPACAKKQIAPVETPVEEVSPSPILSPPSEESPVVEEKPVEIVLTLEDVFFDFDKYTISEEYKQVLVKNAEIIMANSSKRLLVEGYCDERGTIEYNMALGEKRAKAVVDFFATYGIKQDRITWISYGEERPFDTGHDESAWAKNRRAHLALQ